jgi:chromosome segregation protein
VYPKERYPMNTTSPTHAQMRIDKLEIQGFKSFADRTVLGFGSGVTGVVGPNGCGKSNVVDALRWVMGEQSAKHLRGGKMQDVIFGGSEVRGPQGMAEVTITFDTSGSRLAGEYANYAQVQVTRRLYRDGESDYEINKTPCRLKDVHDFFLGTGIGTKGFSIIEQGQISNIVRAKADDRRNLIDEAAGITKYKMRRQAAERKMKATEQNLLRITDVIGEVQKRLGSLKRQAKKAERYKALRTEARDIELHSSALRFLDLKNALQVDHQCQNTTHETIVGYEAKIAALEAEVEVKRLGLLDEDKLLSELQARQYEIDNQIALAEGRKKHAADSIEAGDSRQTEAREELAGLNEAIALLTSQKKDLETGAEELLGEASNSHQDLGTAETELNSFTTKRLDDLRTMEDHRLKTMELATQKAQIHSSIENIEVRLTEIAEQKLNDVAAQEKAAEVLQVFQEQLKVAQSELADAETEWEDKAAKISGLTVEITEKRDALTSLDTHLEAEKEALGERKSRLTSLEEIERSFERSPKGVQSLMENASTETGLIGLVADLFEAPEAAENPVANVLGEKLQMVVVRDENTAAQMLARLSSSQEGRAALLVDQAIRVENPAESLPGTTPLLQQLEFEPRHHRILDFLLGRVLWIDDEDVAYRLWPQAREKNLTLVTSQGTVLEPTGFLKGGCAESEARSLLTQKREIRELAEDVDLRKKALAGTQSERTVLADALAGIEEEHRGLVATLHQLELLRQDRSQLMNRQHDEITRCDRELSDIIAGLQDLNATHDTFVEQRTTQKENLRLREEAIESNRDDSKRLEQSIADLDLFLAEKTEIVTQLRIAVAAAESRREHLQQSLAHHAKNEEDINGRIQRIKEQIEQHIADKNRWSEEIVQAEAQIAHYLNDRTAQKEVLEQKRSDYEGTTEIVRNLDGECRELRANLDGHRKTENDVLLRIRENELELDGLNDRTLEAYGVLPKEILYDYHLQPAPDHNAKERVVEIRRKMSQMGEINMTAIEECHEYEERYLFLKTQSDDLTHALEQLEKAIVRLNRTTKKRFKEAFDHINDQFQKVFPRLFKGGKAWLSLTDPNDLLTTGVEIYAQPPGKKLQSIALMSGGEKALTAVSLLFAIFLIKPSPFCLLDEVDAPLDDSNVSRFNELVKEISRISQFIIITHNKQTMETADQLYGITMEEPGISKAVNVMINDAQVYTAA